MPASSGHTAITECLGYVGGGYGNVTFWSRGTLGGGYDLDFGGWAKSVGGGTEIGVRPRFWGILSQGYGNVAKIGVRK